jgi:nitrogen fixation-related uncharacterized protein
MKEIFIKNRIIILRVVGVLMLAIGFIVYFWTTPKEGYTKNQIAAQNVARMEARAMGSSSSVKKSSKSSSSKIMQELKNTQEKQVQYLIIIIMILGAGSLGYSFIKPKS